MSKIKFYKDSAKTQQVYPELDPEDITRFESLEDIENAFPNVSGEDTNLTLNHTVEAPMKLELAPSELEQETTSGKNLWVSTGLTEMTINGITYTPVYDEGGLLQYINANGTAISNAFYNLYRLTLPAGTYVISGSNGGSAGTYQIGINFTNIATNRINQYDGDVSFTVEEESTFYESFIRVISGQTLNNVKFYPMVRLASITDSTYESYTGGLPQPNPDFPSQVHSVSGDNEIMVCGKNLSPVNSIVATGTTLAGGGVGNLVNSVVVKDIPVKSNQRYKISLNIPSQITSASVFFYNGKLNANNHNAAYVEKIRASMGVQERISASGNKNSNYEYMAITLGNPSTYPELSDVTVNVENIMVRVDGSEGNYEPYTDHTYPINLGDLEYCKIGDYSDEFFKNDPSDPNYDSSLELGKWYLKKNVGKVVLDGSENWDYNSGNSVFVCSNLVNYSLQNFAPYCNNYKGINIVVAYKELNNNEISFLQDSSNNRALIKDTRYTIASDFKTWLSTHNTTVYYVLDNPQYILLNDTLQHQLDDIYNWVESYPGQTNISQINNDLPFIISAHAMKDLSVIDKYPTENSEHLVESGGVYEVVKVQNEHTTQIAELERASLIYNALPKITDSGKTFTLDNTVESPLELELSGNTSQKTTTGIQCFDKTSINSAASGIISQLDTGIKLTNAWATTVLTNTKIIEQLKPNTTYSCRVIEKITSRPETMTEYQVSLGLYRFASGDIPGTFIVLINDNSAKRTAPLNTDIEYVKTFTTPSDLTNFYLLSYSFMTSSGAAGTIELKDLMIVEGSYTSSDFPDYEQFTGEIPSPNPSYSQNINVVKGSNEIYIQNQNKLTAPYTSYTQTKNGMTLSYNTLNEHILTGTATALTSIAVGNLLKYYTIQNNDYLHLCNDKIPTGTIQIVGVSSTNSQIFANTINSRNHIVNLSPWAGKTLGHLQFYFVSGASVTDMKMTPMILNGVSTATNYIEHKEQSLSLNLPVENLVSSYRLGNNIILLNNATSTTDYVFNPGTYTISAKGTNLVSVYYKTASENQTRLGNLSDLPITINATENFNIWFHYSGMAEGDVYDIQLEKGTKADSYTPYGTAPIELCKIGDYADYFYKNIPGASDYSSDRDEGAWYLKGEIKKIILNGSESGWTKSTRSYTTNSRFYNSSMITDLISNSTEVIIKSNYFIPYSRTDDFNNQDKTGISLLTNVDKIGVAIQIPKSLLNTDDAAGFKTWLSTHNTTVYYVLATPIYTKITDPTLISQLEDISMAISYQTQTNISQTNNDLSLNIDATAVLDLNTLINAIVSLGGNI